MVGLQWYCDALVVYVHWCTCVLCSSNLFYYIYFQVEQAQSPNNNIKSAGIPAQGESMLTTVITETTCWGSNSFQISRCCSWCTNINLVMCLKGCCPVVSWGRGHACMLLCRVFCCFAGFDYAEVLSSILKASLIHTVSPFLASKT